MKRRRYGPPKADPHAIIAGMQAHAPDPATQERIDALAERWGVKGKEDTEGIPERRDHLHSPASDSQAT